MRIRRFIAIFLAMLLVLPLGFAMAKADGETPKTSEDIWEQINAIEETKLFSRKNTEPTTKDFANLTDDVEKIVLAWDGYVEGSLVRNGDVLFWDGVDGTGYGYLPHQREKMYKVEPVPASEMNEDAYEPPALRGGHPGSRDVAVFQPYYGIDMDFTARYATEGESIAAYNDGYPLLYRQGYATIDAIANALEYCGVVFFDSHGDTDYWGYWEGGNDYTSCANTSYLCLQSGVGLTQEDQRTVQGSFGEYKHAFYGGSVLNGKMQLYYVDGTAIANHMKQTAPNSFLWMGTCLGMATDGLVAPLREKGVEVVYGYSQSVSFYRDYKWEAAFWSEMKNGRSVADAARYMKEQWGVCDSTFLDGTSHAYPIFVSSEDVYPGQGNVDAEQEVQSEWVLKMPEHEDDWVFDSFNWVPYGEGYIAFAVYTCTVNGEITQCIATVNKLPGILPRYTARISALESLDEEAHEETKTGTITMVDSGRVKKEITPVKPFNPKPIGP